MITKEELEEKINEGCSLTEIAEEEGVDVSRISRLCKEYGIQAPRPGRKPGYQHSEETKIKIAESIRKRREGG
jgi:hypothetical protein